MNRFEIFFDSVCRLNLIERLGEHKGDFLWSSYGVIMKIPEFSNGLLLFSSRVGLPDWFSATNADVQFFDPDGQLRFTTTIVQGAFTYPERPPDPVMPEDGQDKNEEEEEYLKQQVNAVDNGFFFEEMPVYDPSEPEGSFNLQRQATSTMFEENSEDSFWSIPKERNESLEELFASTKNLKNVMSKREKRSSYFIDQGNEGFTFNTCHSIQQNPPKPKGFEIPDVDEAVSGCLKVKKNSKVYLICPPEVMDSGEAHWEMIEAHVLSLDFRNFVMRVDPAKDRVFHQGLPVFHFYEAEGLFPVGILKSRHTGKEWSYVVTSLSGALKTVAETIRSSAWRQNMMKDSEETAKLANFKKLTHQQATKIFKKVLAGDSTSVVEDSRMLTREGAAELAKMVQRQDIAIILEFLQIYTFHQHIQFYVMEALINVMLKRGLFCIQEVGNLGGCDVILSSMKQDLSLKDIQTMGCWALCLLSQDSGSIQRLGANGGCELICELLKAAGVQKTGVLNSEGIFYALSTVFNLLRNTSNARQIVIAQAFPEWIKELMEMSESVKANRGIQFMGLACVREILYEKNQDVEDQLKEKQFEDILLKNVAVFKEDSEIVGLCDSVAEIFGVNIHAKYGISRDGGPSGLVKARRKLAVLQKLASTNSP